MTTIATKRPIYIITAQLTENSVGIIKTTDYDFMGYGSGKFVKFYDKQHDRKYSRVDYKVGDSVFYSYKDAVSRERAIVKELIAFHKAQIAKLNKKLSS